MIKVKYAYDKDKRECSLLVKGHAGQADIGQDIVCASASILAYTIAQVIKSMEHHGDLAEPPIIELESGDATIVCRAKDDYLFSEMMQDFFVIRTGYALLAHNYPQYVEIITDGEA
jgi:uncharacterized protein YsxB (DUF464 family)